jgi:hypothetical protein
VGQDRRSLTQKSTVSMLSGMPEKLYGWYNVQYALYLCNILELCLVATYYAGPVCQIPIPAGVYPSPTHPNDEKDLGVYLRTVGRSILWPTVVLILHWRRF